MNSTEPNFDHLPNPSRRTRRFLRGQSDAYITRFRDLLSRGIQGRSVDPDTMRSLFEDFSRAFRLQYQGTEFDLDKPRE